MQFAGLIFIAVGVLALSAASGLIPTRTYAQWQLLLGESGARIFMSTVGIGLVIVGLAILLRLIG